MNGQGIDTSAMLTMLALVAAVWAVVPSGSRLSFRLALSWWDWAVIWGLVLAIHCLYFEPVLRQLRIYPVLGPWKWGFDKGGTQYLLFLMLASFTYLRSRRTRLNRRKLPLFARLATSLLHARKFEELAQLLDDHLQATLVFANRSGVRSAVASWIRPTQALPQIAVGENGAVMLVEPPRRPSVIRAWNRVRWRAASLVERAGSSQQQARTLTNLLLSSRQMVGYLALARPHLCVDVMQPASQISEDFQDLVFQAMLADDASILYLEIKNSQNLAGAQGHRLALPNENYLLSFYLKDVEVAGKLGVYRSVGEAVLSHIECDEALALRINGPLLAYQEVGKFRCPIYVGVRFFRIMVLEGLHQRSDDHLWLHYFPHFSARLVARAREAEPDDSNHEFATPLSYLLHELIDGTCAWIDDAARLTAPGEAVAADSLEGDHVYVAFQAAEAVGRVLEPILRTDRVTARLKSELLAVILGLIRRVEQHEQLSQLATAVVTSVINPYGFKLDASYLTELNECYEAQDHVLRAQTPAFGEALANALAEL
jgi:hypothetical protein